MTLTARIINGVGLAVALGSACAFALAGQGDECAAQASLMVLRGQDLASLRGVPAEQISLYRASDAGLVPIPVQIDRRDEQGRYLVDEPAGQTPAKTGQRLDSNDELVIRASDAAARWKGSTQLTEIELPGGAGWVYAGVSGKSERPGNAGLMAYDAASDQVTAPAWRVRFDAQLPFLVDSFQWRTADPPGWSPDMTDTMKIRHEGHFLGLFPFQRTEHDYISRLTGVKAGPLRIIRRTENHIRMLWTLQSPAVHVDYVVMPHGFVMSTLIDVPFRIGLFFRDVETRTTVDWNSDPQLPRLMVHAPDGRQGLAVNGRMSAEKEAFNRLQGRRFAVSSLLGNMSVELELPPGAPITPWLYLRDAQDQPDPPEHDVGQFGNVGFRTTGWEEVEPRVQHMNFAVCLETDQ